MRDDQKNLAAAVERAVVAYAEMLGVTTAEAVELYRAHESTRESIQLLVLVQADQAKLAVLAKKL